MGASAGCNSAKRVFFDNFELMLVIVLTRRRRVHGSSGEQQAGVPELLLHPRAAGRLLPGSPPRCSGECRCGSADHGVRRHQSGTVRKRRWSKSPALNLFLWGAFLIVTAYVVGTLYDLNDPGEHRPEAGLRGHPGDRRQVHRRRRRLHAGALGACVAPRLCKIAEEMGTGPRVVRDRPGGRAASRHRQARYQPRRAQQGKRADADGVEPHDVAHHQGHRAHRADGRPAPRRAPDRPVSPRVLRRHRLLRRRQKRRSRSAREYLPSRTATTR